MKLSIDLNEWAQSIEDRLDGLAAQLLSAARKAGLRLNKIESRVDELGVKATHIETRVKATESMMNSDVTEIIRRIENLESKFSEPNTPDDPYGVYPNGDPITNTWRDVIGATLPVHDIIWAARQMQDGKRVRRKGWSNKWNANMSSDGIYAQYCYGKDDGVYCRFSIDDLLATDWEVAE